MVRTTAWARTWPGSNCCALRGLVRRRFALASEPTDLRWRRSSVFRTLERLPIVPEGDAQKTCE
ncbi:hypothetical protein P4234_15265 [Pseudomonas aeruginosa]|nr:hypothetical protein [Pseudomonas aeruginosa]